MTAQPGEKKVSEGRFFRSAYECYSFFTATALLGLVTFVYGVARALKDTVALPKGKGEFVNNLKLFAVLPFMYLFKKVYDKLNERASRNQRYFIIVGYFIGFFALYLLVLRPNHEWCENLFSFITNHPWTAPGRSLYYVGLIFKYWHVTLFYVHSEAIGTFILGVLVWAFINSIVSPEQAKRHYVYLNVGSGVSTILAGDFVTRLREPVLVGLILGGLLALLGVYYAFARYANKNPELLPVVIRSSKKKKKASVKAFFKEIFSGGEDAQYIFLIFLFVFCFAFCTPLFEALHKNFLTDFQIALGKSDVVQYYSGLQLKITGILSVFMSLVVAPYVNKFSWRFQALVTPVSFLLGAVLYMVIIYFEGPISSLLTTYCGFSVSSNWLLVVVGLATIASIKAMKYTFNDPPRERAYGLLDEDTRSSAKSSIDGLGSRFGKSGGGGIISILSLLVPIGSAAGGGARAAKASAIYLYKYHIAILVIGVLLIWVVNILSLSRQYNQRYEDYLARASSAQATSPSVATTTSEAPEKTPEA